jgi:hypothetical protein
MFTEIFNKLCENHQETLLICYPVANLKLYFHKYPFSPHSKPLQGKSQKYNMNLSIPL